jgi:hypothetical protein
MFDIWKGWPYDGALNDNAEPLAGEDIIAGMAIAKDANGKLIKAVGTEPKVFWAIENQDAPPVQFAGVMPYIVSNAIILTDQYDATADYTVRKHIMVDRGMGREGKLVPWDADAAKPVVGHHDGFVERDGYTYLKLQIA